jgi:hypothetical protein
MKLNTLCVCTALVLAVGAAACTKSSPTRPTDAASAGTSASVSDATAGGATVTTPTPASPANGARFKYTDQPLTLTINNAATTGGTITYSFQVASDSGFANVVFSKDGVAPGNGTTSVKIDPALAGNKDYYWHARAVSGGTTGAYSTARTFNVGPQIVINAPTPISPANGGQSSGTSPSLTVANATRTGPAGPISYLFQVSDSSSFGNVLGSATVGEGGGQTAASVDVRLTPNAVYYWRAQAQDLTNNVQGPFSPAWSFTYVPFDMRQAVIHDNPPDVAYWGETAKITMVEFRDDAFLVDFDKRDGPDHWPEASFGAGGIEYTLGLCGNLGGTWHCSAVVQFWFGRELTASTPPSYVGRNWFYDSRWGPLNGYQPQDGETVGVWVGAGNLRGQSYTGVTCPRVCERSNVQMVSWANGGDTLYTFGLSRRTLGLLKKR